MRRLTTYGIIIGILITFLPIMSNAQITYEGINILEQNPDKQEWNYHPEDDFYSKNEVGYFDMVVASENNIGLGYIFNRADGTGLIYNRVYNELVNKFGEEDRNNDYIPDHATDDWDYVAILVDQGKAEVDRFWEITHNNRDILLRFHWAEDNGMSVAFVPFNPDDK